MNIKLKRMEIQSFKGIRSQTVEFGDSTRISGANATGKTSLFDAFTWLLFDKDSLGNSKFNIRPLDKDGNKIHNTEIKVAATLDVDGKEVELSKTQKEKWVKKRGTSTPELQGNENVFEVDGYPKSEKEFKSFIAERLSEDLFKVLTNPQYFPNLPWKEQRAILMRFAEDVSDAQLAVELGDFDELVIELERAPSTDDIQKKYAKALSEWKKKQAEIPVRIDELEKTKADIDVAELELAKAALSRQLADSQEKKNALDRQIKEQGEKSRGIMELKFELSDLKRAANAELDKRNREATNEMLKASNVVAEIKQKISAFEKSIEIDEQRRKNLLERIQKLGAEFKAMQNAVFDDSTTVCSLCGQEYPEERKAQMKADFEKHKQTKLEAISKQGKELMQEYKALDQNMKMQKAEATTLENDLRLSLDRLEVLKIVLYEMPDGVDISDREDVVALKKRIAEAEQAMVNEHEMFDERECIADGIERVQKQILSIAAQIAKAEGNKAIDERIAELQTEQRSVAQKVADQEKMIYLLEQFIRAKMDHVAAGINEKFDGVAFKLFDMQVNGGVKECCECTVNGVPYGSLNNGHRIVAGLTIIKALQTLYGAYLPIWVDNAESINEFNIPRMNNQMILLAVDENTKMKVEV